MPHLGLRLFEAYAQPDKTYAILRRSSMSNNMPPQSGAPLETERPFWPSIILGLKGKCPACGEGTILKGYLRVSDHCPHCNEALYHQRADDGPAYLTLIITGHILAPVMLMMYRNWDPNPLVAMLVLSVGFTAISLYLLPKLKGAFVALQWAKRMHGFGRS